MFVAVEEKADAKSGRTLLGGRGLCRLSKADAGCDSPVHMCHGREGEWDRAFEDPLEVRRLGELQWIQGAACRGKMDCGHLKTRQHKYFKEGLDFGEIIICNIKT